MNGPAVLKQMRENAAMSQHDLAVAVGKTANAVSQWERGVNVPRRTTVTAVDRELDAEGKILLAFGYSTGRAGLAETERMMKHFGDVAAAQFEGLVPRGKSPSNLPADDDDVRDRVARLERLVLRLASQLEEVLESDEDLEELGQSVAR